MCRSPDICSAVESQRTAIETHLFGTFKGQSFGCKIAGENSPRSRPTVAPAGKDQFAKRYFGGRVLRIGLRYQTLVFEEIKLATEQEPLDLVFYFAQIESDVGTHHARVVAVWDVPGQEEVRGRRSEGRRRKDFLFSIFYLPFSICHFPFVICHLSFVIFQDFQ